MELNLSMLEWIRSPWPWYVSGPLIGLMVPGLLLLANKRFGISSNLRHICAACFPGRISFFKYDWKKEAWNLFFAAGIMIGAFIAAFYLQDNSTNSISPQLAAQLQQSGINSFHTILPPEIFSWQHLSSIRTLVMTIGGGFLIGFGTRYAGGCTSGHSIMGLSNLQWPSLVATVCFMIGGVVMSNLILPYILKW
jgi:uncharacterized membrane protein YedE/YeeE